MDSVLFAGSEVIARLQRPLKGGSGRLVDAGQGSGSWFSQNTPLSVYRQMGERSLAENGTSSQISPAARCARQDPASARPLRARNIG